MKQCKQNSITAVQLFVLPEIQGMIFCPLVVYPEYFTKTNITKMFHISPLFHLCHKSHAAELVMDLIRKAKYFLFLLFKNHIFIYINLKSTLESNTYLDALTPFLIVRNLSGALLIKSFSHKRHFSHRKTQAQC